MGLGHNSRTNGMDAILTELAELIDPWADAKADCVMLDNKKKVILAQHKGDKGTIADKEDAAYTSQAYDDYLKALREAVRKEAALRARREYLKCEFENSRSDRADNRALMKGV